jgi:hypothetical protein
MPEMSFRRRRPGWLTIKTSPTGAIVGNLLGCMHGLGGIPARWLEPLELRDLMVEIADDLATAPDWKLDSFSQTPEGEFYRHRYPPN